DAVRPLEQQDVRRDGQKYTDAENLERVLAAQNGVAEPRGLPAIPSTRDDTQDNDRDRQKVHEPKRMQVRLVDRMAQDPPRQRGRLDRGEKLRVPAHGDTITDPVGPEFMAPPARVLSAAAAG